MSISSSILKGLYMMRHKPLFISRFIMNTLRTRILDVHSLRSLCFALTYKCNFDCEHCWATFPVRGGIADFLDQEAKYLCILANPNNWKLSGSYLCHNQSNSKIRGDRIFRQRERFHVLL